MISEPSSIHYACVSKGATVLAEFSNGDQDLEALGLKCIESAPDFHLSFSHTVGNRIYGFLIESPFVYFAMVDKELGKVGAFRFLERVKEAFLKVSKKSLGKGLDNLKARCLNDEFSPVFRRLLGSGDLRLVNSPEDSSVGSQNGGHDSRMSGKKAISVPLLGGGTVSKHSKKKKNEVNEDTRDAAIENKVDVSDDDNSTREFSASLHKNGSYVAHTGRHHAKKMWRRHVWTVLVIDLVICCVLFGAWLYICKGFECLR